MKLIDIHAHLEHDRFKHDLDKVIENAKKANVKVIITSGVNPSTNRLALEIQKKYPDIVKVSFGIYPIDALAKEIEETHEFPRDVEKFDLNKELAWIEKNQTSCIAIGECGMDFKYGQEHKEKQAEIFKKVIELAIKLDKPLILHTRKAEQESIDILEKINYKKIIMHCFNGSKGQIKRAIELGYSFSIPPIITRLEHFQMLASMVPITQLLTETDAPYLAPKAGERNESSNVKITIKEIAKIKNLDEKQVAEQIYKNYKVLFE